MDDLDLIGILKKKKKQKNNKLLGNIIWTNFRVEILVT